MRFDFSFGVTDLSAKRLFDVLINRFRGNLFCQTGDECTYEQVDVEDDPFPVNRPDPFDLCNRGPGRDMKQVRQFSRRLDDFTGTNVDNIAMLLEGCGRFLLRSEDTAERFSTMVRFHLLDDFPV